jgi:hypothetical protein
MLIIIIIIWVMYVKEGWGDNQWEGEERRREGFRGKEDQSLLHIYVCITYIYVSLDYIYIRIA